METVRDFIAVEGSGQGNALAGQSGAGCVEELNCADGLVSTDSLKSQKMPWSLLRDAGTTAAGDAALWGFQAAADFAGTVEEFSRVVEYLQLVAAGAVDRTRKQAAAAASAGKASTAWTTGWRDDSSYGVPQTPNKSDWMLPSCPAAVGHSYGRHSREVPCVVPANAVDDGYRNAAEFLRARLRISAAEARRRLALAGTAAADRDSPANRRRCTGTRCRRRRRTVPSRSATIVTRALARVRHLYDPETAARMEDDPTRPAAGHDPDFVSRVARRWTEGSTRTGPNRPKKSSAGYRARSSANPAAGCTIWNFSPRPNSTNSS